MATSPVVPSGTLHAPLLPSREEYPSASDSKPFSAIYPGATPSTSKSRSRSHCGAERLKRSRTKWLNTGKWTADSHTLYSPSMRSRFSYRRATWEVFSNGEGDWSRRYQLFSTGLVLVNVVADVLDSVSDFSFSEDASPSFRALERFTCATFTVEYVLRIWSCVEVAMFSYHWFWARLAFMLQPMILLDAFVLAVFYADLFVTSDASRGFASLRLIRSLRLVALLKMERQTGSIQTILAVLGNKSNELFATLFMALVVLIMSSTAMYYVENSAQPEKFASIPATMWWSVTAMTTVGYGDIFPTTTPGKVLGSAVAFVGIGLFALPSGIVSSGFIEFLEEQRQHENEEIADMIDEDKVQIEYLTREVVELRSAIQRIDEGIQEDRKRSLAMHEEQRQILELLRNMRDKQLQSWH